MATIVPFLRALQRSPAVIWLRHFDRADAHTDAALPGASHADVVGLRQIIRGHSKDSGEIANLAEGLTKKFRFHQRDISDGHKVALSNRGLSSTVPLSEAKRQAAATAIYEAGCALEEEKTDQSPALYPDALRTRASAELSQDLSDEAPMASGEEVLGRLASQSPDPLNDLVERADAVEQGEQLRAINTAASPKERELLMVLGISDTIAAAARTLGIPAGTARERLNSLRKKVGAKRKF